MREPAVVSDVAPLGRVWRWRMGPVAGLVIVATVVGLGVGLWPASVVPSAALIVPALLVIAVNLHARRRLPDHPLRPAWSLLAVGMALSLTGELARIVGEFTLGWPLTLVAIGFNLAAYPFYLVSSGVRIQRAAGRSLSVAAILDALTCALVAGAFGALAVAPLAAAVPPARLLGVVMPPLLCFGMLVVALYLLFQSTRDRPQPAALALIAAAVLTTAGNWLVALDTLAAPVTWAIPLAMALLAAGFLALALLPALDARERRRWPDPIGHLQSVLVQALPLGLLALLAVQVIGQYWDGRDSTITLLLMRRALAAGTLLVVVRQWLMLRLNARLLTSLQATNAALAQAHAHAAREARTDNLTGLPNQRLMREYLATAVAAHRRAGLPLSLLFVDLDHFKAVNDRHGHAAGDIALVEIGRRLRQALREGDVVARFGGEEFVLLLPHTDRRDGEAVAERLRQAISAEPVAVLGAGSVALTVSIGLATGRGLSMTADGLLRAADAAMYAAKQAGRDGVRVMAD